MSTERAEQPVWERRVRAFLIGAAAFGVLALLSLMFAREAGRVAAIWPANGVLLALILLRPRAERAALIGGAFLGNVAVTLGMGDTPLLAFGLSAANAVEIAIAAWLLRDAKLRDTLLKGKTLLRFAVSAGLAGPAASSVMAAGTLYLWHHEPVGPNVLRWLIADGLGMLITAPPLLVMASRGAWAGGRSLTGRLAMGVLLAGTLAAVFLQTSFPLLFLIPPVLILIVFRCGAGSASMGLLVASVVSLAAVATGHGPIALIDGGLDQRAMMQQLFLATMVFTTLPVAALVRDRAESEARYRALAETATDIVCRFDRQGRFLYVSPAAKTVLGRDPEDMLGKDCTGIIPPENLKQIGQILTDYVAAGPDAPAPRYEYPAIKADGTSIWLEATPRAVRDEAGRLVEFHDFVRDVTERKAAEAAQLELMETLRLAESLAGLGSWKLDLETGQTQWSNEVYRIHGVDRESFDPNLDDAVAFYHPDDRQAVRDWIARVIDTGKGDAFKLRLIRADGEERIVASQCRPDRRDGRIAALYGVFQDVTERERAAADLAASEARYRLMADTASDIIATYGHDQVITYVSPSVEAVTGRSPDSLIGRPTTELMHPDDADAVIRGFDKLVRTNGDSATGELRYRAATQDGSVRWLDARTTFIRDDEGRIVEFRSALRDITAAKALEDELIAAKDAAEAAARAKSDFLSNMSHELRTPLTSVIGFSGLLRNSKALPDQERRFADRIGTASEALLGVINDILDYSKLEAGAVDLDPRPFDPAELAASAAAMVEQQCEKKGLALVVAGDRSMPGALMGDDGRLRQVLLNFLSNAVKFTASGEVRLETRWSDGRFRAEVTDSGIGISPDKIDALFERFTQADASTTRNYGGTGLGLAISRRLIEMMGGEIGATSRPGEGSTFWFEVPLPVAEAEGGVEAQTTIDLPKGLRVLMADDAPANRELIKAILGPWAVDLETVENGAEAVQAASRGGHDLILMDVHMPVMDGMDATRAIRSLPGTAGRVPVIALTANVQPEQVDACRAAGMDGHVGKPIQVDDLIAAMAGVLPAGAGRTASEEAA